MEEVFIVLEFVLEVEIIFMVVEEGEDVKLFIELKKGIFEL